MFVASGVTTSIPEILLYSMVTRDWGSQRDMKQREAERGLAWPSQVKHKPLFDGEGGFGMSLLLCPGKMWGQEN
jgi:hypothetical protein